MPQLDLTITNSDGGTYVLSQAFEFQYQPPVVTGLSPTSGPIEGGTTVTISGSGFREGLTVAFGGKLAQIVSVTPTEIVCVTPSQL